MNNRMKLVCAAVALSLLAGGVFIRLSKPYPAITAPNDLKDALKESDGGNALDELRQQGGEPSDAPEVKPVSAEPPAVGQRQKPEASGNQSERSTFRILSWNVQTFGKSMKAKRQKAYESLIEQTFSRNRSVRVLAVQEISSLEIAQNIDTMFPGPDERWKLQADRDSNDSMDNFFYTRDDVTVDCERILFSGSGMREMSKHPARIAHMRVGDFDFTIITLHLTYGHGSTEGTERELRHVLDWVKKYLAKPNADPDVIIVGDFNMPTEAGKAASVRQGDRQWRPIEDILADYPKLRLETDVNGQRQPKATELIPLVDDRTSRSRQNGGGPANNYDHFIVTGDLFDEEYVQGSAGVVPPKFIQSIEDKNDVLMSDHYPISAGFRMGGMGNDGHPIKPDGGDAVCSGN